MSLVTIASAPSINAVDNSFTADARIADAVSKRAGGTVLSFACLNQLFKTSE